MMRWIVPWMVLWLFWVPLAGATTISTVSTVGEARVEFKGNDRAAAFKKAVREALKDAVMKEASLLADSPDALASLESELDTRLKDLVVKYQILEARFSPAQLPSPGGEEVHEGGERDDGGTWYVKVKAFVDTDLLQRSVVESGPIEGG